MKSINDGLSVASKNVFQFFTGGRALCFQDIPSYSCTKTSKKACVKENEHVYLFLYVSLCFGNSHSCFQIKSSDYRDGVSVKLKYLDSYDYIFIPVPFIISLQDSHFGSGENMLVSHQNKSWRNRCRYLNISRLLYFILTYCSVF